MRIAFLTEYFAPFEVGGAERSAARLAQSLVLAGHDVTVFTPDYGALGTEVDQGVTICRLPFPSRVAPGALAKRRWMANPLLHLYYGIRIARELRRFDLLHVQNSGFVVAGAIGAKAASRPMVLTIRDLAYLSRPSADVARSARARIDGWLAPAERRLKTMAARTARRRIFVSRGLMEEYRSSGAESLARDSRVIYNIGPQPTRSWSADAGHSVLFVGKLSHGKGLHVLNAAVPLVRERVPQVRFLMAGVPGVGWEGTPEHNVDAVQLLGRVSSDGVEHLMQTTRVFVSPSIWPEPLSRAVLEAMAVGMPIVATRVGGTSELLEDGVSALLVEPGDAAALAQAIARVLTDSEFARALGSAAYARYREGFTPERIVPQVIDAYETLG
jgi:glycosyltransferase involved in cell wall biosynthesis